MIFKFDGVVVELQNVPEFCKICGEKIIIDKLEEINRLTNGKLEKVLAFAKFCRAYETLTEKILNKQITLTEAVKSYRELQRLRPDEALVGVISPATYRCKNCGGVFTLIVNISYHERKISGFSLKDLLKLEGGSKYIDYFFKQRFGKSWDEVRREAEEDEKFRVLVFASLKELLGL